MTISMRVLPRFPARVFATDGLTSVRDGTDIIIKQDWGSLIRIPAVDDPDKVFFIAWNSDENVYSIMSFTDTFNAVIDTTGLMTELVYDPQNKHADAFARANHTGTQAQSTVVNLVSDLAAKASVTDLAAKAPLASPALTGSPTAPTQSVGDNSTKIATTAYADAAAAAVVKSIAPITLSGLGVAEFALPTGARVARILFSALSTSGTVIPQAQIGTASAFATSGYSGSTNSLGGSNLASNASIGVPLASDVVAATVIQGYVEFTNLTGNTWVAVGFAGASNTALNVVMSAVITLAAPATRVRLSLTSTTFDSGTASAICM